MLPASCIWGFACFHDSVSGMPCTGALHGPWVGDPSIMASVIPFITNIDLNDLGRSVFFLPLFYVHPFEVAYSMEEDSYSK